MTAVAIQQRDFIIAEVAKGAMLKAVAAKVGVTPSAISQVIGQDPEYRKAREVGAEVRLEEQFEQITTATSQEATSRAREGFRAAAWFAEREFPQRWGQKSQVTVELGPELSARLRESRERLAAVEGEVVAEIPKG